MSSRIAPGGARTPVATFPVLLPLNRFPDLLCPFQPSWERESPLISICGPTVYPSVPPRPESNPGPYPPFHFLHDFRNTPLGGVDEHIAAVECQRGVGPGPVGQIPGGHFG